MLFGETIILLNLSIAITGDSLGLDPRLVVTLEMLRAIPHFPKDLEQLLNQAVGAALSLADKSV
jgi:hypothetical protein